MADKTLFGRLTRLFATDVVIRNVGGNQLKVTDINQIQKTGKFETNSLLDRFTRLYQYNKSNIFSANLNYQTLRIQLYADYEAMDSDPINLWSWTRNMCKYGDFFLKLEIAEKFGVYNVLPYTVYHIARKEGLDPENPSKVIFELNPDGIGASADTSYLPNYRTEDLI